MTIAVATGNRIPICISRHVQARLAESKRDAVSMIRNERIALALNMGGMVAYVALFVFIIIIIIVTEGKILLAYQPSS